MKKVGKNDKFSSHNRELTPLFIKVTAWSRTAWLACFVSKKSQMSSSLKLISLNRSSKYDFYFCDLFTRLIRLGLVQNPLNKFHFLMFKFHFWNLSEAISCLPIHMLLIFLNSGLIFETSEYSFRILKIVSYLYYTLYTKQTIK